MYIEEWGKSHIKNKSQVSKSIFIEKYGSLALYDEDLKKIIIIDHDILELNKTDGCTLIGIPEKENGTLSDHEYFLIHDDIFDIIQSTHQDRNILWKFISNEPNENESHSKTTEIHNYNIQNTKRTTTNYSTKHTLQRKGQKNVDYRKKIFDDFRLMVLDPPPKLNSEESDCLSICFCASMENQSDEVMSKILLTHILNVGIKLRLSCILVPFP